MTSLLAQFLATSQVSGTQTALVEGSGQAITFQDLAARVQSQAHAWQAQGIRTDDAVLVAMPVSIDLYVSLAALWSLGATAVLPEPAMGLRGVRHALGQVACRGLAASGPYVWLRALLPSLWGKPLYRPNAGRMEVPAHAKLDPEDASVALISFTSGSTGVPKAMARTHGFLRAQFDAISPLLLSDEQEIDLVCFPVFTLLNLAAGRTSVLPNWSMTQLHKVSSSDLLEWIDEQKVTRALLPPSLCETLSHASPPRDLKTIFTGGGPVFPDLIDRLRQAHPTLEIMTTYGSTEAEPIAHLRASAAAPSHQSATRSGAGLLAGHPIPEIQVQIRDGEIIVAGDHVNQGYLDPKHDGENKIHEADQVWHRTGDAGRLDEDGRLWLLGRLNGKAGPYHPFEVETAARLWPGVRAAALIAIDSRPVLAIDGLRQHLVDWRSFASQSFPGLEIAIVRTIPLDARHHSKVDYAALAKVVRRALGNSVPR